MINVNWTTYFIGLALVLLAYYGFIFIRYYFTDYRARLAEREAKSIQLPVNEEEPDILPQATSSPAIDDIQEPDPIFEQVEIMVSQLRGVVENAHLSGANREQLLELITPVIAEHKNLEEAGLRPSINELIQSETEKYAALALRREDVEGVWDQVG